LSAGGGAANRIAKWDGSSWSALGSGIGGGFVNGDPLSVRALAVSGTNLYAGGNFTTAGGKVSAYAAKANIGAAGGRFSNPVHSPATGFSYTFLDATPGEPYRIQSSPSLATASWTDFTNFVYAGPVVITDASAIGTTKKFYRAITP